jgi:D-alanyl-D-alanine carboxypeptidase (penicillin-binding protein 5/6)
MRIVSVVLGASTERVRADGSQALLNYGFRFF